MEAHNKEYASHMTSTSEPLAQSPASEGELKIVLMDYEQLRAEVRSANETITQTMSLYIGLFAFLAPVAGAVAVFSAQQYLNVYIFASIFGFISVASAFTMFRAFHAKISEATNERAITRLNNYIIDKFPDLRPYFSGTLYDDPPLSFTAPWASTSVRGLVVLALACGVCAALALYLLLLTSQAPSWIRVGIAAATGIAASSVCILWLSRRLRIYGRTYVPRFPRS